MAASRAWRPWSEGVQTTAVVVVVVVVAAVVVVVVVVVVAVVVAGGLVGWMKREQIASPAGPSPWPCLSSASYSNGSFAGLGSLLRRNKKQKRRVRIMHL